MTHCPACERTAALDLLKREPTEQNRAKLLLLFEIVESEGEQFIVANMNIQEMEGCSTHTSYQGFQEFLLSLNSEEVEQLLFPDCKES